MSALAALAYAAAGLIRGASGVLQDPALAPGERTARAFAAAARSRPDLASLCVAPPVAAGRARLDAIRLELRLRYLLYPLPVRQSTEAGPLDAIIAPTGSRSAGRRLALRTSAGDLLLPDPRR